MKTFASAYAILDIKRNELFPSIGNIPMLFLDKAKAEHRANICEIADWAIIKVDIAGWGTDEIDPSDEPDCGYCGECFVCQDWPRKRKALLERK